MEKVKLPRVICNLLDSLLESHNKGMALWIVMQNPNYLRRKEEPFIKLMYYSFSNDCEKLAKAILYGYEPEETKEEIKEREIKEKMLDYIEDRNNKYLLKNEYIDVLYNIAHGKE